MIFSPSKLQDMKDRELYLGYLKEFIWNYRQGKKDYQAEVCKIFGDYCAYLKKRIETHDYSKEDELYRRYPKLINTQAPHPLPETLE